MRRTQAIAKRLRPPAVVAAAILAAVEGGILPPGLGLRSRTRRANACGTLNQESARGLAQSKTWRPYGRFTDRVPDKRARLSTRLFHPGRLYHFRDEIVHLPFVAGENFLNATLGVHHDRAKVVIEADPFAREYQTELFGNGVDLNERTGGKAPVIRVVVVPFRVVFQNLGRVVFGVERNREP